MKKFIVLKLFFIINCCLVSTMKSAQGKTKQILRNNASFATPSLPIKIKLREQEEDDSSIDFVKSPRLNSAAVTPCFSRDAFDSYDDESTLQWEQVRARQRSRTATPCSVRGAFDSYDYESTSQEELVRARQILAVWRDTTEKCKSPKQRSRTATPCSVQDPLCLGDRSVAEELVSSPGSNNSYSYSFVCSISAGNNEKNDSDRSVAEGQASSHDSNSVSSDSYDLFDSDDITPFTDDEQHGQAQSSMPIPREFMLRLSDLK